MKRDPYTTTKLSGNIVAVIGIPIEVKAREFHGKLWLSVALARAGHKVALGDRSHMRAILFEEIRPDIYISNELARGGGGKKIYQPLKKYKASIMALDSEGGLQSSKKDWLNSEITEDILDYIDKVLAWGQMHADALDSGTNYESEDVHITGNPRFDLLHPENRNFYHEPAQALQQEHGNYVLINTNFGLVNAYDIDRTRKIHNERNISYKNKKIKNREKTLQEFISLARALDNNTKKNIIIRPHPGENHETYRTEFNGDEGINVIYSGDVRNWIMGSDAVIHRDCTTGIESALLNKLVISFDPLGGKKSFEDSLPKYVSQSAENIDEVVRYVNNTKKSDKYELTDEQESKIKYCLENVNKSSTSEIVELVNEISDNKPQTKYPKLDAIQRAKSFMKKMKLAPNILDITGLDERTNKTRTGRAKQKIPKLELSEVKTNLKQMNIDTSNIKTDRVTHTEDVFWINDEW